MPSIRSRTTPFASVLAVLTVMGASSHAHAITGGTAAPDSSYSFIVKLQIGQARACTGVLVQSRWVVTSASCFQTDNQPVQLGPPPQRTTAVVGAADLTRASEPVPISELVPYSGRNVVLAKLSRSIAGATPIPVATAAPASGERLLVAGFGRTRTEWVPQRLQVGTFAVQDVSATTLSVVGEGQANTCRGDSGGPTLREREGRLELVAITSSSWQTGCLAETDTRSGGTQTRVDDVAGWLTAHSNLDRLHGSIQSATSGRCLDVLGNTKNKDPVRIWDCAGGAAPENASDAQRWFFDNAEGRFKHRTNNQRKESSLDFPMWRAAGTQVEIYEPTDLISQKWSLSGGLLINGKADSAIGQLCLDVPNADFAQGVDLRFSNCTGNNAQKFTLPGDGTIRPLLAPQLCVDNDANLRADGNPIQLWACNGAAAQKWDLSKHGLVNEGASAGTTYGCLDRRTSGGAGPGSPAQFWSCNGQPQQYFEYLGTIFNQHDLCLDVRAGAGINGTAVQGAACTGNSEQIFYYRP